MQEPEINVPKWVSTEDELPDRDGYYLVTNNPKNSYDLGCCQYDGYGFRSLNTYRNVKYWMTPVENIKRYGKISKVTYET
jgi:hypothetical protein